MLFQKFTDNPNNVKDGHLSQAGMNKLTIYSTGLGAIFGYVAQKATGILEQNPISNINDWSGLEHAAEQCKIAEAKRLIVEKVENLVLDPSTIMNCVRDKYADMVAQIDFNNSVVAPMLSGSVGGVIGTMSSIAIGVSLNLYMLKNPKPPAPKM